MTEFDKAKTTRMILRSEVRRLAEGLMKFPCQLNGLPTEETRKRADYQQALQEFRYELNIYRAFDSEFKQKYRKEIAPNMADN